MFLLRNIFCKLVAKYNYHRRSRGWGPPDREGRGLWCGAGLWRQAVRQHKRNRYKKVQAAPTVNNALGRYSFYSLKSNVALSAQTGQTASQQDWWWCWVD